MNKRDNYKNFATNTLKGLIKSRGFTYEQLSKALHTLGVEETETSIKYKLMRGTFSFTWFLQCCKVLNIRNINLDILYDK